MNNPFCDIYLTINSHSIQYKKVAKTSKITL